MCSPSRWAFSHLALKAMFYFWWPSRPRPSQEVAGIVWIPFFLFMSAVMFHSISLFFKIVYNIFETTAEICGKDRTALWLIIIVIFYTFWIEQQILKLQLGILFGIIKIKIFNSNIPLHLTNECRVIKFTPIVKPVLVGWDTQTKRHGTTVFTFLGS